MNSCARQGLHGEDFTDLDDSGASEVADFVVIRLVKALVLSGTYSDGLHVRPHLSTLACVKNACL